LFYTICHWVSKQNQKYRSILEAYLNTLPAEVPMTDWLSTWLYIFYPSFVLEYTHIATRTAQKTCQLGIEFEWLKADTTATPCRNIFCIVQVNGNFLSKTKLLTLLQAIFTKIYSLKIPSFTIQRHSFVLPWLIFLSLYEIIQWIS